MGKTNLTSTQRVDAAPLLRAAGISKTKSVKISLTHEMSSIEQNPRDDWLWLGISSMNEFMEKSRPQSVAIIGSGNGIDAIACLRCPGQKKLFVTDLLSGIMGAIKSNVESNRPPGNKTEVEYLVGRDCAPLRERVDLIYANLPLLLSPAERIIGRDKSTTTLTDASAYLHLSRGKRDPLLKWSLLSQLGFLLSAKEKLAKGGKIITLIGGRVPYGQIAECFVAAGLSFRRVGFMLKPQSDPEFLQDYAQAEKLLGKDKFTFLSGEQVERILVPRGSGKKRIQWNGDSRILKTAMISAQEAWQQYMKGKRVLHTAYAFLAEVPENGGPKTPHM